MISTELYIQTVNVFDNGVNEAVDTFSSLKDTTKSWNNDQWKNYYIRIVSGSGAGQESIILGNDFSNINFTPFTIVLDTTSVYQIYAYQYNRIEQYNDEKISITQTLQDSNDIGKLFTDYTQSFTVPASNHNNKLFKYWYNVDLDDGFDHRTRQKAYIEINTQPFKKGQLQLEKVNKKNGFIDSYTLTFYGNLTQLKDKFQDDKLNSLVGYETLNHPYNSTEVIYNVQYGYPIGYPLISSDKKYSYKNGSIYDISTTTGAVVWNELFPAIPISKIFEFIQNTYGITFTGSFFTLMQWQRLSLYLKNAEKFTFSTPETRINFTSVDGIFPEMNLTTDVFTMNWNYVSIGFNIWYSQQTADVYITPTSGFESKVYTVRIYKNNKLYRTYVQIGTTASQVDAYNYGDDHDSNEYYITVSCQSDFEFTTHFETGRFTADYTYSTFYYVTKKADGASQYIDSIINLQTYVPDIKVSDFVEGIIKAFNLMVIPTDLNTFEFISLEDFYLSGKETDITEFTYSDELEVEKPIIYKSINFEFEKSTNILNNKYFGLYNKEYGDLIYKTENSNESETYDIKLPFENVLFEKTVDENFLTATIVDKDLKPYIPKPMLIFDNGVTNIDNTHPIKITTDVGGYDTINVYSRFSNEFNIVETDTTLSYLYTMNFNNEQSPWYNVIAPKGLYYRFYENYVDNLYNLKTRNVKVKAILPPSLISQDKGIKLNERLIISNQRYIINSFTTDLTTGETSFNLITDYRGVNAVSTVGYRFADKQVVQVDKEINALNFVIYLNDFEKFDILSPVDFLIYTPQSGLDEDFNLLVAVPKISGATRTETIGIAYYRNGAIERTEYILITQTDV